MAAGRRTGPPKRLALGAAMGTPAASISASATGWAGMRMPTLSRPAVQASGTMSRLGSSRVSGPGMKRCASFRAEARPASHQPLGHGDRADVHDDRVPGGPLLGGEDAQHRLAVQRVGPQSVNGFRGNATSPPRRMMAAAWRIAAPATSRPNAVHNKCFHQAAAILAF